MGVGNEPDQARGNGQDHRSAHQGRDQRGRFLTPPCPRPRPLRMEPPRLDIRGLSSLGPDLLQVSTTPICSSIASSSKISNSSTTLPRSKRDRMWPSISTFFPVAGMSPSGPSWVPTTFQ